METDKLPGIVDFERNLKVGDEVLVKWTTSRYGFSAISTVHKINDKSIVVTLNQEVPASGGAYPKGHKIRVPRFTLSSMKQWTMNNCVQPKEGY